MNKDNKQKKQNSQANNQNKNNQMARNDADANQKTPNNTNFRHWEKISHFIPLILICTAVIILVVSLLAGFKTQEKEPQADHLQSKAQTSPTPQFPRLTINCDSAQLQVYFNPIDCKTISYTSIDNELKQVNQKDFDSILNPLFSNLQLTDSTKVPEIVGMLGLTEPHIPNKVDSLTAKDIAFSLIYNTIVRNEVEFCTVQDGKLVKESDLQQAEKEQKDDNAQGCSGCCPDILQIIAVALLLIAAIWLIINRKQYATTGDTKIIKQLSINLNDKNDTMKTGQQQNRNNEPENQSKNSLLDENATVQRTTQTSENQYTFENFICDENGIIEILAAIDKNAQTHMAEQFQENLKKVKDLQTENNKLAKALKDKDKELADANVKNINAGNDLKQVQNALDQNNAKLKNEQKAHAEAVKKLKEAEENYAKVSEWMPLLKNTTEIMGKVKATLAQMPQLKEANAWNNLLIAEVTHFYFLKLLGIWMNDDKSWQAKLREKDFTTTMEKDAVTYEKLKQFVNAISLQTGLRSSSDIDTMTRQKMQEGFGKTLPIEAVPDLNNVIDKSIQARIAFEQSKPFMDAMFKNFVQEFVKENPAEKGQTWYFEHLINIAYHAIDYILMMEGQNPALCYNYQFLSSNFNPNCPAVNAFEYKHADKSSDISNTVYDWTTEMGIKQLRVLIDKYLIKP